MHFHLCRRLHPILLAKYLQIMGSWESEAGPMYHSVQASVRLLFLPEELRNFFCTTRSPSPTSPLHSPRVPRRYCSPLGSGLLPGDPGAGRRCRDLPCTPRAQPCPVAAADGTQNSFPPLCSGDRSEAGAGSRDLEEEVDGQKEKGGDTAQVQEHQMTGSPCLLSERWAGFMQ